MTEYNLLAKKRKIRQLIMAGFFLFILIAGWFWPLLGYFVPLCMLFGIGIGIFRGRKWCDWFCPRGSFYDTLVKPLSPQKEIPHFFKRRNFRIAILILLSLIMASNLISRWPDPRKIGYFFITMLTATTVIGVVLGLILHQRTWCFFCPVGSLAGWIGAHKYPLKIIVRLCNECQLCHKVCPMQIAPKDRDCLKCNLCIWVCPAKALTRDKSIHIDTK